MLDCTFWMVPISFSLKVVNVCVVKGEFKSVRLTNAALVPAFLLPNLRVCFLLSVSD